MVCLECPEPSANILKCVVSPERPKPMFLHVFVQKKKGKKEFFVFLGVGGQGWQIRFMIT